MHLSFTQQACRRNKFRMSTKNTHDVQNIINAKSCVKNANKSDSILKAIIMLLKIENIENIRTCIIARFIRRISVVSNAIRTIDSERRDLNHLLLKLHSMRRNFKRMKWVKVFLACKAILKY